METILQELRTELQDVLGLCNSGELYKVDARKKKKVASLKEFIFKTFEDLLKNKAPIVPKVCSRLNSALAKRWKTFRYRPIWPSADFYTFCVDRLKQDAISFPTFENDTTVLKAMASYLHDTGSIICIPKSDWHQCLSW